MTLCERITNPITRMVEEGKNLDEIAEAICPSIQYGRQKIIRIIKDFLGEEYLTQHAETLKYDIGKADLAKKRKQKSHEKIDAKAYSDSSKNADASNAAPIINICCQKNKSDASNDAVSEKIGSCCQEKDADTSGDEQESEEQEAVSTDIGKEIEMQEIDVIKCKCGGSFRVCDTCGMIL